MNSRDQQRCAKCHLLARLIVGGVRLCTHHAWEARQHRDLEQNEPIANDSLPEFLKVAELARMLNLSRSSVYDLIGGDVIPGVVRIGRRIRIHRPLVERWVTSGGSTDRA